MLSLRKTLISTALAGLFGAAAWATLGCWRGEGGSPSTPSNPDRRAPGTTPPPKPQALKLPQTLPTGAAAVAPALPSYLYLKYLPDDLTSAGESNPAAAPAAPAADFGTPHQFPAARLRVSGKGDDGVTALLFSDDPKEAMDKDWTGDRYYFAMNLQPMAEARRLEDRLNGAQWGFTASASEREENRNGLFLHGDQMHLEPVQVWVQLEGQAPNVQVKIAGEFLQYDTSDPNAKPKRCQVMGILAPRVEIKE